MVGKYKVITLCGSTRFKNEFMRVQKELTLKGFIVISVGLFGHSGDDITDDQKIMLDDMHKRKIDMADEIFVINPGEYIGDSTRSEIEYAEATGKKVFYLTVNPYGIKWLDDTPARGNMANWYIHVPELSGDAENDCQNS